jgi:hypothetical protein
MEIPNNVQTWQNATSISWIDNEGIMCSISKKGVEPTIEELKQEIVLFRSRFGEGKFRMLINITDGSTSTSKEQRDYVAELMPQLVTALAMVSRSALSRMAVNLFFGLKPPSYPTKIFGNEKDAREWLEQYK